MNCANHPDREKTAFCQNCGKPLCQECTRVVGTAVFCEPCLAARLAGAGTPPPAAAGTYTYTGASGGLNYNVSGTLPPPGAPGAPNPALAALLGIIPGVGAMYNGQFAKGIVHLVVFAILVSLSHENGIFGLFIAGWVCYQIIEAYHTARARRDGTPLPNPFGLNDLGERLGFGRSWSTSSPSTTAWTPGSTTPSPSSDPSSTSVPPIASAVPPAASAVPPTGGYAYNYPPQGGPNWGTTWESYGTSPNPYTTPVPPVDPNVPAYPRNRFPMGAVWLIGLGVLFLIGNSGIFHGFPIHRIIPFFLIGLGIWLFYYKMTTSGPSMTDDGSSYYRVRLVSALRGSVWVILVGIMFLLSSFGISWGRTWPLFIIVAGLMTLFERTVYRQSAPPGGPWSPPQQPPYTPPAPTETPIVPSSTSHDQEER